MCRNPTVNLRADKKIKLTFLFATGLVRRSRVGCALRSDLNLVLKLLWRNAYEEFRSTPYGQVDGVQFRKNVVWHKRDEQEVRGVKYVTAHCASNRPAFVVLTGDSVTETENEILHMYCAMSLPEAHNLQQTVLARISSLALAAALVKAAVTLFDFRYADESVCSETPELQAEWDDLINEMRVSRGPAVVDLARAPQEVIASASRGPSAQAIVGMLDFAVGEELTEFVVQMDRAPNAPLASHMVADVVAALDLP